MERKEHNYYCWAIAYIDSKYIKNVQKELSKYPEFAEVEAYIPTIRIVKKNFKKETIFDDVPLLFNYGFFKIPRKFAVHMAFLELMKKNITCIYAWVKDTHKVLHSVNKDEIQLTDYDVPIGTTTSEHVANLIKLANEEYSIHDKSEINKLKEGDTITLRGYPWEGLDATVVKINHKRKTIIVNIHILGDIRPSSVSFDNIFFTVYRNSSKGHNLTYDDKLDTGFDI